MIHPTAIIHPRAKLHPTVQVGPYAVIDADVTVGAQCMIGPHVYLTGVTDIGEHNRFHAGCVIGDAPQDLKYKDEPTRLRIGDHNVFREHATVQRSTKTNESTVIGSHNFLMVNSHVAHNCTVGDHVIVANGVLLAGHASVGDRAFLSGNCLLHQFVRVGTLALMQGGSSISRDLPPFTVARHDNGICGLNIIGLRRAGLSPDERLELKRLYKLLFINKEPQAARLEQARKESTTAVGKVLVDFVATAKRGVCADVRSHSERESTPAGNDNES